MTKKTLSKAAKDNAVQQLQALIPALQQFLGEEAKEPVHQEGADPTMVAGDPNAAVEGGDDTDPTMGAGDPNAAEGGEGGSADIAALIQQVQAVLAQLSASVGGGSEGAGNGEGTTDDDDIGGENEGEDGAEGVNPTVDGDGDGEGAGAGEEGNGKASPGPAAGRNAMAGDSAVKLLYRDLALKSRLYDRVSKVVGAFDHAAMDAHGVAVYGVNKIPALKGKVKKGNEAIALDMYLTGREEGGRRAAPTNHAADGAVRAPSAELDAYLKGSK